MVDAGCVGELDKALAVAEVEEQGVLFVAGVGVGVAPTVTQAVKSVLASSSKSNIRALAIPGNIRAGELAEYTEVSGR